VGAYRERLVGRELGDRARDERRDERVVARHLALDEVAGDGHGERGDVRLEVAEPARLVHGDLGGRGVERVGRRGERLARGRRALGPAGLEPGRVRGLGLGGGAVGLGGRVLGPRGLVLGAHLGLARVGRLLDGPGDGRAAGVDRGGAAGARRVHAEVGEAGDDVVGARAGRRGRGRGGGEGAGREGGDARREAVVGVGRRTPRATRRQPRRRSPGAWAPRPAAPTPGAPGRVGREHLRRARHARPRARSAR
jgi:hypothetical protein